MILFVFFHSFLELHHLCMRPQTWHRICCGSIKLWEDTNRFNKISRSIFTSLASCNWCIHRLWSVFYILWVILIFKKFFSSSFCFPLRYTFVLFVGSIDLKYWYRLTMENIFIYLMLHSFFHEFTASCRPFFYFGSTNQGSLIVKFWCDYVSILISYFQDDVFQCFGMCVYIYAAPWEQEAVCIW